MTEEDIADPHKRMFEFHVKDNPHKAPGSPTLFESMQQQSDKLLGLPKNVEDKIQKYAYVQYEWIRLSMEAARRNKWYCSGIQYWMYNDCWPAVGLSLVDHFLIPKAGYYAAKRAAKPVIASVVREGGNLEVWVLNDSFQMAIGELNLLLQCEDGSQVPVAKAGFVGPANESVCVCRQPIEFLPLPLEKNRMVICEIKGEFGEDRAYYYPGTPGDLSFAPTELEVTISGTEGENGERDLSKGTITVRSKGYARVVSFDGGLEMSDSFFDLMPGEERVLRYECREGFSVFDTKIQCWN